MFKSILIDKALPALISIILSGKVHTPIIATEVCRIICNCSYLFSESKSLIGSGNLILSFRLIYFCGLCSAESAVLILLIMKNVSELISVRSMIVEQEGFKLLVLISRDFVKRKFHCSIIYSTAVSLLYNLVVVPSHHEALLNQGIMEVFLRICTHYKDEVDIDTEDPKLVTCFSKNPFVKYLSIESERSEFLVKLTQHDIDLIGKSVSLLSDTKSCHTMIVEGQVMKLFRAIIIGISDLSRGDIASALANISASKPCREELVLFSNLI
jgi:hypothetical protein